MTTMSSLLTYKYYDTPEGQDIFKKTIATSKNAVLASIPLATFDVLLYSHPKGFFNTALRYGSYFGTAVGMATAFTLTTNIAQNVRGKNDRLNYFMGGAAAGMVFSALRKIPLLTLPMSIVLGCAAVAKKEGIDEGHIFFPKIQMATKNAWSARNDWTIAKDIEELKTWTTVLDSPFIEEGYRLYIITLRPTGVGALRVKPQDTASKRIKIENV